jgi:hypothetical protein
MSNGTGIHWRLFTVVLTLCLAVVTDTVVAAVQTIDIQVSASSDDAEEAGDGEVDLKSSDLEMVYDHGIQTVGIRFRNIAIDPGATIVDAYLQFTVDETKSTAGTLTIAGEFSENAATFSTAAFNISSRPLTAARITWNPETWNSIGAAGNAQRTPNLAAIISETINSGSWSKGNALALIISGSGERVAESFNGEKTKSARLIISYDTDGSTPVNTPPSVTVSSPVDGTVITEGDSLSFTATATDAEDGNLTAGLAWTSSIDGPLPGSGGNVTAWLSTGTHIITASLTDSGALSGSDTVSITVEPAGGVNTPPTVTITSPTDGTVITEGEALNFTASATDNEDGDITAALVWTSSIDNALPASGGSANVVLSRGTHIISTTLTDSGGLAGSDTVTITVTPAGGAPEILDLQISTGTDDAEERSSGSVSLSSSDLEMTFDRNEQMVGLRFTGVSIDPGAVITNAWVQFTVDEVSTGATDLVLVGDASNNAAVFSSTKSNLRSRPRTASQVNWSPADWTTVGAAGAAQRTPDLAGIIYEIVSQPDWSRGNALALLISGSGKRVAESANGKLAAAPILHIEYLYGGNRPPAVEAGADSTLLLPANTVNLNGSVGDDGLPESGSLTSQWTHVGGTGTGQVAFADRNAADTTATIGASVGTYVLRLTGDDGESSAYDEMIVSVSVGGTILSISQTNYFDTGFANSTSPLAVPSIDPAGLVYHAPTGRLIIADSEINEVSSAFSIVQANLFAIPTIGGTVYDQWDTTQNTGNEPSRNREPTGITYCSGDGHFYISNDDSRYIYRYAFDGNNFTAVDAFDTQGYQSDPEGITCDPATGRLYVIGGVEQSIMILSYNGGFVLEDILSLPSTAGNSAGVPDDAEGIAYDPGSGHLYVLASREERIYEYTLNGSFVKSFDLSHYTPKTINAQGLTVGPASDDSQQTSFYISDGMVDNDSNANERDGRIYEARILRAE